MPRLWQLLVSQNKSMVICLRWPIILVSACMLLFTEADFQPGAIEYAIVLGHVVSNVVLYFIDEKRLKSTRVFLTLVLLDTLTLTYTLVVTHNLGSELYHTYFLIIAAAAFWKDVRCSLGLALIVALVYGCLLFWTEGLETAKIMRIPFLFTASIFYGYFAQLAANEHALRKSAEQQSQTDFLTGLPNRRFFQDRLDEEFARGLRYGRPLSLLILDVDNFKVVNDSLGHPCGDSVLQNIGKILIQSKRGCDCAARVGGEEFAVILPETDLEGALVFGERLCREIRERPVQTETNTLSVTVSIGASSQTVRTGTADDLYAEADKALYRAKSGGKNRVESLPELSSIAAVEAVARLN
jgi:diguanylate cyclase (GGDEF)-like protein